MSRTNVFSLFGQIETVVAYQMMAEGRGVTLLAPTERVQLHALPPSTRWNAAGKPVLAVVVMSEATAHEFDERVRQLKA